MTAALVHNLSRAWCLHNYLTSSSMYVIKNSLFRFVIYPWICITPLWVLLVGYFYCRCIRFSLNYKLRLNWKCFCGFVSLKWSEVPNQLHCVLSYLPNRMNRLSAGDTTAGLDVGCAVRYGGDGNHLCRRSLILTTASVTVSFALPSALLSCRIPFQTTENI